MIMFHPLKNYLPDALKRTGAERSVTAAMIVEETGPILLQIVAHLKPSDFKVISYQNGCVTVAVASPAVGQELRIRAESIIEAMREIFQQEQIRRLKLMPLIERD